MTKEEAIEILENGDFWDLCVVPYVDSNKPAMEFHEALGMAIVALRAQQELNDPLTLEELREMDGEPVYDWMGYEWFVVSEVADDGVIMTDGTVFDIDEDSVNSAVGRFYRRKPEEG